MLWKLRIEDTASDGPFEADGRFVMQRHVDADGPHIDLRIEDGDCLRGWRVAVDAFEEEALAVEKGPHPLYWLDELNAGRMASGVYGWRERGPRGGVMLLKTEAGVQRLTVSPASFRSLATLSAVENAARALGCDVEALPGLAADGATARSRAIGRLCGLGRELDGDAFDETLWRTQLAGLNLDEIHRQLRAFEVRFDRKYPPQPITRPEALPDETGEVRGDAMAILLS